MYTESRESNALRVQNVCKKLSRNVRYIPPPSHRPSSAPLTIYYVFLRDCVTRYERMSRIRETKKKTEPRVASLNYTRNNRTSHSIGKKKLRTDYKVGL